MRSDLAILSKHREHFERVDAELAVSLGSDVSRVEEISRHTLLGGGKRLRPLLFILSCGLCDSNLEGVYRFASIFEIIHAASLLHDDVLDNAETRRNRPSANVLWGNHAAVLVGDFLYSKSFSIAVETSHARFLRRLTETTTRMAEGQVLELEHTHDWDLEKDSYLEIIKAKTAVLISAACESAAILNDAGEKAEKALADFGFNMGIAFQLMDDILDYTATEKVFGKPVAKDLQEGKVTLPLIYALEDMEPRKKAELKTRFQTLASSTDEDYQQVLRLVRDGDHLERVREEACHYVEKAGESLMVFPDSAFRRDLLELDRYIVERTF